MEIGWHVADQLAAKYMEDDDEVTLVLRGTRAAILRGHTNWWGTSAP